MPDYQNGKIYQIVGNGLTYVGSTVNELQIRLSEHKSDFKRWEKGIQTNCTSYDCLTDPDCKIELLEACPCASRRELAQCERQWIETLDCVNKRLPGRTREEKIQQTKEWRIANRQHHLNKMNDWRKANRAHIAQYQREYRQRIKLLECNQPVEPQP